VVLNIFFLHRDAMNDMRHIYPLFELKPKGVPDFFLMTKGIPDSVSQTTVSLSPPLVRFHLSSKIDLFGLIISQFF
jgi:hypothetical protein